MIQHRYLAPASPTPTISTRRTVVPTAAETHTAYGHQHQQAVDEYDGAAIRPQ